MKKDFLFNKIYLFFICTIQLAYGQGPTSSPIDTRDDLKQTQQLGQELKKKYVKLDSYIDLLLLAILTQKHVLAFGGPGGSKTALATDVLGAMSEKTFSLQFSPATKEEVIRGVLNVDKMLKDAHLEYNLQQSLLKHNFAILDEIDKANPEVLAALLSVLHERQVLLGHVKVSGDLKTALITSNMTIEEFLQKFRATNDESTGKAILDRVAFKILVLNRLPEAEDLYEIFCTHKECHLPQNVYLQDLAEQIQKIVIPKEVAKLAYYLWAKLGKELEKEQAHAAAACAEDADRNPYIMSNQFTTRGAKSILEVMKAAKVLALIAENMGAPLDLHKMEWTPQDIQYAQAAMILQGPAALKVGSAPTPESIAADDLHEYLDVFEYDPRTQKMLQDLILEREKFEQIYWEVIHEYQDEFDRWDVSIIGDRLPKLQEVTDPMTFKFLSEKLLKKILAKESEIHKIQQEQKRLGSPRNIPAVAQDKVLEILQQYKEQLHISEKNILQIEQETAKKVQQHLEEESRRNRALGEKVEQLKSEDLIKNTRSGYPFTKVVENTNPALGEAWLAPNGVIWGDVVKNKDGTIKYMSLAQAHKFCLDHHAILPTKRMVLKLFTYFIDLATSLYIPQIFSDAPDGATVTSSMEQSIFEAHSVVTFDLNSGTMQLENQFHPNFQVRCVILPQEQKK